MKNQMGSIIILTLIVMTALIIMIHSTLGMTTYFMLLAQEREIFEKNYQKTAL